MFSGDTCLSVFPQHGTGYRRRMAVDGFVVLLGSIDFSHQFRVAVDDTRVVHHLREIIDVRHGHQFLNSVGIEGTSSRFKSRGRHTTRRAKEKLERHLLSVVNHVADAFFAQYIGDFVRVADRGHRAMAGR